MVSNIEQEYARIRKAEGVFLMSAEERDVFTAISREADIEAERYTAQTKRTHQSAEAQTIADETQSFMDEISRRGY